MNASRLYLIIGAVLVAIVVIVILLPDGEETAQQIMSDIRALPGAGSVTSDRSLPRQELTVTPDRLAMADKGVTTQDIATTLRIATGGDYEQSLSKLNLDTRQIPIVVRL